MTFHNGVQDEILTYTSLTPVLMHAQHGDIASVRDISVHTLLAHDHSHRIRRLVWISLNRRSGSVAIHMTGT